jgi:nitroreductase
MIQQDKFRIIEDLVNWIKIEHPSRTSQYDKCHRDLEMIFDAIQYDIENDTDTETQYIANKFWSRGEPMLIDHTIELKVYDKLLAALQELDSLALSWEHGEKIQRLITSLKDTVANGPTYDINSWDKVCNDRIATFNWTTEVPDKGVIKKIIHSIHEFAPSKQRRVRYTIDIVPNYENEQRKHMIYAGTKANPSRINGRYNPQVLAPWLLAFDIRYEANIENYDRGYYENETWLDIGIAMQHATLAAGSFGLDVGFCLCIQNRDEIYEQMGIHPVMYLCLGYKDPAEEYYCPVYQSMQKIPKRNHDTKPPLENYTRWH